MKVVRLNKKLPLPKYQTKGAVGLDLYVSKDSIVKPNSIKNIPAGIVVGVPEGYCLLIKDRSSIPKKLGLIVTAGVVDQDYCGDKDEIHVQVYNSTKETVKLTEGMRLANAIIIKIDKVEIEEVESISKHNRGGFGSTGI
jgi:dUTP pyrophosphatase